MKKNLLPILSLLFVVLSFFTYAQPLAGTYGIPADFPTIEKAIDSLNQVGVGGNVTFNVAAGHTETFSKLTAGLITATGYPDSQIVFQKSGGSPNPKITAAVGGISLLRDGIIILAGGDYITFDAIDVQENSLNTNKQNMMEWGYALVKASKDPPINGCRYVTIKNCNISLSSSDSLSTGIYANNHTADTTGGTFTLSDSLDVMSYCKFYSNTISNVFYGFRFNGNLSIRDKNNEIGVDGGNIITSFGNGAGQSAGIYVDYQDNLMVANNNVNGGGSSQNGVLYGIRTGSGTNTDVDIYNNTVTLIQGSSSLIYGIANSTGSSGTTNTVNIYNNIIEGCSNPISTSNTVWLLYNIAGAYNLNIYGNIVRNNSKGAGTGTMHCLYLSLSATTNAQVYDNQIYNNTSAGPINGIFLDVGTNTNIHRNKIYDLTTISTSSAVSGVLVASGPINTYIYNNFISDLKAPSSSSDNTIRGINITSTTANSNIGLYYNTIFLNSSGGGGSSGIFHTNNSTATTAALDMRNNIVVNNSSPGAGKTVAFRRSAANVNLDNYSTASNNNSFYAGTPGVNNLIFYDGTNSDQNLAAFKERVSPREGCSVTENVPFVNSTTAPYDLHVSSVSTQVEGAGKPISTPLTINGDFDGITRNAITPDIGADEFTGTLLDISAPSISYTLLIDTISTSNRILAGVSIEDCLSGVNVTALPRIYYKKYSDANTYVDNTSSTNGWKYAETTSGSSPFDFTINYSLLFGGTVQSGDTIQYFVVAEDVASTPNVGIRQGTFAATPSSVNLTSAAFPITGTINMYKIQRLISGTVTVGTGGDYLTLTGEKGLFVSINENFLSGNTVAKVISDITEPGTYALNEWNEVSKVNYTLTIQPDTSILRTLSGSYVGGLIRFNGADKVTIDGRFNGSGNYLTFENTNTASSTTTFQLLSLGAGQGCTDITIRNCNIKAGSNTSANIFGIFAGSSTGTITTGNAGGADFDNLSILENNISKCRTGFFARGTSSDQMQNLIVSGNVIGSNTASDYVVEYGIYLGYADAPQVTSNEIFNMIFNVSRYGVYFINSINNAIVSKNKIHSFDQSSTTGYQAAGIMFSTASGCSDNRIDNNMIYNLKIYGSTTMYLVGIRIVGGSSFKVYHNTVTLTGAYVSGTASVVSSCLYIPTAATNIDIRNNIFSNTMSGNNPKNYLIHSLATTTFAQLDYNDYWNTGSVFGYFGADKATFAIWKTDVGKDLNSKNVAVTFVSTTDAHLSGSSIGDGNLRGTPIAGITSDIDNETRNAVAPYMGADEIPSSPLVRTLGLTALIEGFYDGSSMVQDTVTAELHNASSPYALVDQAKVVLNTSGVGIGNFYSAVDATNYYVVVKHRNAVETWSKDPQQFTGGSLSYDFTTASNKAYSDGVNANLPMKQINSKWCFWSGDVTHNYFIEYDDMLQVYNFYLLALEDPGYYDEDITGNEYVEYDDVVIVYNNYTIEIWSQNPLNEVLTARPIKVKEINNRINTQE